MLFKNKFLLSVFLAFMLAKVTSLAVMFKNIEENGFLYNYLIYIKNFFDFLKLENIKAFKIVNISASGFEGSEHIINFLITYTPIFYLFFLLINVNNLKKITQKIKEKIEIIKLKRSLKKEKKVKKTLMVKLALWCAKKSWERKIRKQKKGEEEVNK